MGGLEGSPGEFDLIARIRSATRTSDRVAIGIGDDCASIRRLGAPDMLVTTDMLMDGRHFRLDQTTPEQVGHKALAVNLSDIAAMAGIPLAAVVAVALPRDRASRIAEGLQAGISALAEKFEVDLVGGDTNAWDGPLVISITVLGEATTKGPVRRSGARSGDLVFVTGPLGGSLLGRHLTPLPRILEALALHELVPISAMIDLSDGLASDLSHILEESGGLGAVLDPMSIPIHADALIQSRDDGRPALDHALTDGEDFELCFSVAPEYAERLEAQPIEGLTLFRVGAIIAQPGLFVLDPAQRKIPWLSRGFDHLRR